ncbi:hypothetical protein N824_04475 [Pedobacter sp. V48]|nr:hypothetical protein N824_04475 [Pedobacter sp. V48]
MQKPASNKVFAVIFKNIDFIFGESFVINYSFGIMTN